MDTGTSPRTPGTPSASGSLPAPGCGLAARVSSSADPVGRQRQRPGSSRGIDAAPPGSGRRCGELFQALPLCPHHPKTSPLCSWAQEDSSIRTQGPRCSVQPPSPMSPRPGAQPLISLLVLQAVSHHHIPPLPHAQVLPGSPGLGPRAGWAGRICAGSPPRQGKAEPSAWRQLG